MAEQKNDNYTEWQKNQIQRIEDTLQQTIQAAPLHHPTLKKALAYCCTGGKKTRAQLLLLASGYTTNHPQEVLLAAVAIELFHTYTLIHDDLPDMDNSNVRRNKPTAHIQFTGAVAILAADLLQALSLQTLANLQHPKALQCVQTLAQTGNIVVDGQMFDMYPLNDNLEDHIAMAQKKTSHLFQSSCCIGALLANEPQDKYISTWAQLGYVFGTLFQLFDDKNDGIAQDKQAGLDIRNNKKVFPPHEINLHILNLQHQLNVLLKKLPANPYLFSICQQLLSPPSN